MHGKAKKSKEEEDHENKEAMQLVEQIMDEQEEEGDERHAKKVEEKKRAMKENLERLIQDTYDCMSEVMYEIAEAKREQKRIEKIRNPKRSEVRPQMGRQVFTELRRYNKPPVHLHKLVQAFLLLLGYDEYTTFVRAQPFLQQI